MENEHSTLGLAQEERNVTWKIVFTSTFSIPLSFLVSTVNICEISWNSLIWNFQLHVHSILTYEYEYELLNNRRETTLKTVAISSFSLSEQHTSTRKKGKNFSHICGKTTSWIFHRNITSSLLEWSTYTLDMCVGYDVDGTATLRAFNWILNLQLRK